ncbi:hypothetical protein MSAN_00877700 [Mycena sanguinolenta]|uniref:Uncharacterized protein n=1 Tax=Mycena sanguinolenta TaxID=230812 RepID=A0A8H6YVZ9_9AGAR|nr:hypothetical protein MSAN_00877700 [Mycena sanguinolenta]
MDPPLPPLFSSPLCSGAVAQPATAPGSKHCVFSHRTTHDRLWCWLASLSSLGSKRHSHRDNPLPLICSVSSCSFTQHAYSASLAELSHRATATIAARARAVSPAAPVLPAASLRLVAGAAWIPSSRSFVVLVFRELESSLSFRVPFVQIGFLCIHRRR